LSESLGLSLGKRTNRDVETGLRLTPACLKACRR